MIEITDSNNLIREYYDHPSHDPCLFFDIDHNILEWFEILRINYRYYLIIEHDNSTPLTVVEEFGLGHYIMIGVGIEFDSPEDVILFKLTWL